MRAQAKRLWTLGGTCLLATLSVHAGYINDNFDAPPFVPGTNFLAPGIAGWLASTSSVVVVNTKSSSGANSVYLAEGSAISNAVNRTPVTNAWTDVRLAPMLGDAPDSSATNGASFLCYVDANGYVAVWNGSGWLTCSNDVWNTPVPPLTNGVFATLSVFQNYSASRLALMVNDRVVAQDLPFTSPNSSYGHFLARNVDSNAWMDDVWVQTEVETNRHAYNGNSAYETLADATELQTYGYVARAFNVGATRTYTTLTSAFAVARDRDRIEVDNDKTYNESLSITANVTIAGSVFTNSGTLTVAAGKTVTVASGFSSSLTASGTVALVGSVTLSGSTMTIAGSGQITGLGTGAQLLAGNLDISDSGHVVVTGGRVSDTTALVDMTGTFRLSNTWDTAVTASLDFSDDFERYADGTRLDKLGFAGWGATLSNALVQAGQGHGATKGTVVPEGVLVSNRLNTAGQSKIWTDLYLRPMPGETPDTLDTNTPAFLCYVGTNGVLNVWDGVAGSWLACSNYANGANVDTMTTNSERRVTVFANYTSRLSAVFIEGKLSRWGIRFAASAHTSYGSFHVQNTDGNAWFDNVRITTAIPGDLRVVNSSTDLNGDGIADADAISLFDSPTTPSGTIFKLR